jgi:nucleoid-associated protein YgaU
VLAGCGVALAAAVAPAAHADDVRGIAGQPPEPLTAPTQVAHASRTHVVQPGDSLWSISAARLGPGATDAEVEQAWQALWRANRATVGADPDLIEPGQRLDVPAARR